MQKVTTVISKNDDSSTNTSDVVVKVTVKTIVKNLTGTFNITDIMLQTGDKSSVWNGHPSEMRWTF